MEKDTKIKVYLVTNKYSSTLLGYLLEFVERDLVVFVDGFVNEYWMPNKAVSMDAYLTLYGSVEDVNLITTVNGKGAAIDFIKLHRLVLK